MGRNNSFDFISRVYDTLASIVFGRAIRDCQFHHLSQLTDARRVLILGGGTGWFLEAVLKTTQAAEITYVEASQEMLRMSRQRCRDIDGGRVVYVHGTQEDIAGRSFDAVVANFFLDLFTETTLHQVVGVIDQGMAPDAKLLVSDFNQPHTFRHRLLLRTMYCFFKLVSNIEAGSLPDWKGILERHGFVEIKSTAFYKGFMAASVFGRSATTATAFRPSLTGERVPIFPPSV